MALTEDSSELAQVIEEDDVGWIVPPNAPQELLRTIKDIYTNKNALPEKGKTRQAFWLSKIIP